MTEHILLASDLNGTLTTGSPVLAVHRWLEENQPGACPPLFKYRILFSYLQVKAGLKKIDIWGKEAMCAVLALIQDPTPELLDGLMDYVVINELWPKRRSAPIALLKGYLDQGADLYIISAAYQPAVEKFSRMITSERTFGIGTRITITENSARLMEPFVSREKKLSRLLDEIGSRPVHIALGDTFADIPLLRIAQHPIAVHPDRKLKKVSEKEGWQILE